MISDIVADISYFVISLGYVVGLSIVYLQKKFKSKFQSSMKLWPQRGFVHFLWSVGHLELDLDQNIINSFPCMTDIFCRRKLKYVDQILRYFGNRRTHANRHRQKHYLPPEGRQAIIKFCFDEEKIGPVIRQKWP